MTGRSKSHRVQWGETDAAAIVFYPNYFRWFDQATHDLLRDLGCSVAAILERGFVVPIVEAKGRFLAALAYEDELAIASRVAEVRTRAFRIEHSVTRVDEVVCEGYEVRMWVHLGPDGRFVPEPIPQDLKALLSGC